MVKIKKNKKLIEEFEIIIILTSYYFSFPPSNFSLSFFLKK